jgi:ribosomal protein S18 acetylase RimI-like enzyme
VGLLSNLLGLRDGAPKDDRPAVVRPAAPDELEAALRVVLSPPGGSADARGIAEFVAFARERGMAFDGLHVAERGGRFVSAALPIVSPGRTMLLLLPPGQHGRSVDAATAQLIEPVCRFGADRGVHLAQVLADPTDDGTIGLLTGHGFERMAELHYLHADVPADARFPPLPDGMSWQTYSPEAHEAFGRAILESYKDSLDCPALNGLRDIDDVIAGHQASGTFAPEAWYLLRAGAAPLGVLLLCESHRSDAVELVYLGLSPAARGRRLGELMMRQAVATVTSRGLSRLYLAVDARNTPALKLYYRHGMQRASTKVAMLRDLRKVAASDTRGPD